MSAAAWAEEARANAWIVAWRLIGWLHLYRGRGGTPPCGLDALVSDAIRLGIYQTNQVWWEERAAFRARRTHV